MRLLVLENELTSRRGGQELSLFEVCRGLAARGHQITLAYVTGGDLEADYRRTCEQLVRVRAYSIDRTRAIRAARDFLQSLWAIRGARPDVVYANQYLDSLLAAAASRLFRAPFVCHLRLPPPEVIAGQYRIGLSQVVQSIAISEQTRRDWVSRGSRADRIAVVYNGIDLAVYRRHEGRSELRRSLSVPEDALVMAYVGRLHPAKGIETLLTAFAIVARRRHSHLVVAGRAAAMIGENGRPRDYGAELRGLAATLGIEGSITWIEHQRNVAALFSASDVTVVPSLWSEPFGRAVVESMACETPVVASRVGGIPEILTGEFAAWLCDSGDAEALADRVLAVVRQADGDPAIGGRARAHVAAHFSAAQMVTGVERVLADTCRRVRAAAPAPAVTTRAH